MSWDKEFYDTRTAEQDAEQRRLGIIALACFWGCIVLALLAAFVNRT